MTLSKINTRILKVAELLGAIITVVSSLLSFLMKDIESTHSTMYNTTIVAALCTMVIGFIINRTNK